MRKHFFRLFVLVLSKLPKRKHIEAVLSTATLSWIVFKIHMHVLPSITLSLNIIFRTLCSIFLQLTSDSANQLIKLDPSHAIYFNRQNSIVIPSLRISHYIRPNSTAKRRQPANNRLSPRKQLVHCTVFVYFLINKSSFGGWNFIATNCDDARLRCSKADCRWIQRTSIVANLILQRHRPQNKSTNFEKIQTSRNRERTKQTGAARSGRLQQPTSGTLDQEHRKTPPHNGAERQKVETERIR